MGQEGVLALLYMVALAGESDCRHALCAYVGRDNTALCNPRNMTHVHDGYLPWHCNVGKWDCHGCDGKYFLCCQMINIPFLDTRAS